LERTRILDAQATPDASAEALPPGTILQDGKFRIDQQIGSGGFGVTYLARDTDLYRTVVIKECFADGYCHRRDGKVVVDNQGFAASFRQVVAMFIREARSIAMLRHPNIVRVHQVFEENDTAYMVLDLIEGRDLADIIALGDRELSPDQIHAILIKLLDAIAVVHDNDLLHRDISPDNVLLDKWGSPILIDFGAVREDASKTARSGASMLVVKDGYSPHEFYNSGAQHRANSDLYALGATMYHLISGTAPAGSEHRFAAVAAGEADPCAPLAGRFPGYDPVVLQTIDAAMRIDPAERLQSARAWLDWIEAEQEKERVLKLAQAVPRKEITALVAQTNKQLSTADEPAPAAPDPVTAPVPEDDFPDYRPTWVAEFNMETARSARRRPGQSHIAKRAARMAQKAMQEEKARALLRQMTPDPQKPAKRRGRFAGFFTNSYIVQWMSQARRAG